MSPFGGCGIEFARLVISLGRGIMTITVFVLILGWESRF